MGVFVFRRLDDYSFVGLGFRFVNRDLGVWGRIVFWEYECIFVRLAFCR